MYNTEIDENAELYLAIICCFGATMLSLFGFVIGFLWAFCPNFYNSLSVVSLPNFSSFALGLYSIFYIVVMIGVIPLIFVIFLSVLDIVLRVFR